MKHVQFNCTSHSTSFHNLELIFLYLAPAIIDIVMVSFLHNSKNQKKIVPNMTFSTVNIRNSSTESHPHTNQPKSWHFSGLV